jgi:acyl-CoA reductase-like NAD-dependent aldehyde dehydrogenase
MLDFGMMIGGRKTAAGKTFAVFNPATGALVGEAPNASLADLDDAVTAAQQAFPHGRGCRMPTGKRPVRRWPASWANMPKTSRGC